jgi:hypothetical protein
VSGSLADFQCSSCSRQFWLVWPFEVLKNQVQAHTPIYSASVLRSQGITSGSTIAAAAASGTLPAPLAQPTLADRVRYLYLTHGVTGLYRGIGAGTARSMLSNGCQSTRVQTGLQE